MTLRAGDPIRIDVGEPCAACGVLRGQHRGGYAMTADADDPDHPFALFVKRPTPYVPGGEFVIPKRDAE